MTYANDRSMLATSRSGERFWRRSGSGARRLALEVDDHPAARRVQGLAEVVVAVGPDHAAADAELGARGEALADVLAAADDRRQPLVVGQPHEDPLDVLVDGRGQQRQRLLARLLGGERRVAGVRGEHVVHLGGDRRRGCPS